MYMEADNSPHKAQRALSPVGLTSLFQHLRAVGPSPPPLPAQGVTFPFALWMGHLSDEDIFAHPSRLADPCPRAATTAMFTLLISLLPNPYSDRSGVTLPSQRHQHAALPTASLCPTFQPAVLMKGGCITPRRPSCLSLQHPERLHQASLPLLHNYSSILPKSAWPRRDSPNDSSPNESWVHSFQAGRDVNVPLSNQPPFFIVTTASRASFFPCPSSATAGRAAATCPCQHPGRHSLLWRGFSLLH